MQGGFEDTGGRKRSSKKIRRKNKHLKNGQEKKMHEENKEEKKIQEEDNEGKRFTKSRRYRWTRMRRRKKYDEKQGQKKGFQVVGVGRHKAGLGGQEAGAGGP